jgi:hypothetical protein
LHPGSEPAPFHLVSDCFGSHFPTLGLDYTATRTRDDFPTASQQLVNRKTFILRLLYRVNTLVYKKSRKKKKEEEGFSFNLLDSRPTPLRFTPSTTIE